jgi:GNAT superfamily N-acetyltransferase
MPRGVAIRPMRPGEEPQLRRIVAAAFSGEPFSVGMYGPDRAERYRRLLQDFAEFPTARHLVTVAAVDDAVVALAALQAPGTCSLCGSEPEAPGPDADAAAHIDFEFARRCRAAHLGAGLPSDHARITTVATEPFLAGSGIGRQVVLAALAQAWELGAPLVALECLRSRAAFYARVGFGEVTEFDDPGGPGLRALLMVARRSAGPS